MVNCRLEPFLKFIQFGGVTCPLECYDYSRAHDIKLGVCLYSIAHHEQDPEPWESSPYPVKGGQWFVLLAYYGVW